MDSDYRELLIGCGHSRRKMLEDGFGGFRNLTTLDINADVVPDIHADLEVLPYSWAGDNEYNEIHAYEVLEHTGQQGDFKFFFAQFSEFWRILKPGGFLVATVPGEGIWRWGDPGHRRCINGGSLTFLDQAEYVKQCDVAETRTNLCDYRRWYKADFRCEVFDAKDPTRLRFVLVAVKPSRFK